MMLFSQAPLLQHWYECKQLDIFDRCSTSAIRRVQAAELYTSHVMVEDTKPRDVTSQNGPAPNEQAAPLIPDQQAEQEGEVAEASAGATAASTGATAPSPRIAEEDTAFSDKAVRDTGSNISSTLYIAGEATSLHPSSGMIIKQPFSASQMLTCVGGEHYDFPV